jgi:hypothetical protein
MARSLLIGGILFNVLSLAPCFTIEYAFSECPVTLEINPYLWLLLWSLINLVANVGSLILEQQGLNNIWVTRRLWLMHIIFFLLWIVGITIVFDLWSCRDDDNIYYTLATLNLISILPYWLGLQWYQHKKVHTPLGYELATV